MKNKADRFRPPAAWRAPPAPQPAVWAAIQQGRRLEEGTDGPADYRRAADCYRQAIRLGDPMGLLFLGQLYQFGHGVQADDRKAAILFIKAYRRGICAAAIHMANIYDYGHNTVSHNRKRALRWYRIAARMGRHGNLLARERIRALAWPTMYQ